MGIHTQASLERLFANSRRRQQRLKEQETKKYKKAQESIKKALAKQQSINAKKLAEKAQKQQTEAISRTIYIYNTKYIERFIGEDDLYTTREQLEEAEQRGEGKVNWDKFNEIVEETKQMLNNDQGREKRIR